MKKEAKFILDKPKADIATHIFLKFQCKDGALRYSTKEKILPADWDSTEQRAKTNKRINTELARLYSIVEQYLESCRILNKRNIFKADLKAELDSKNDRTATFGKASRFFTSLQKIIDEAKAGKIVIKKSKKKYTTGTMKNWQKVKNKLLEFNPNLEFETISMNTYNSFVNFCNQNDYAANYTGSLIKDWKALMEVAHGLKLHHNIIYKHSEFRSIKEVPEMVYLNEQEIKLIYDLDLTGSKVKETVRDRYIINLYTGLRISDMLTLSTENIQNGMITHINQKTNAKVVIPVHPYVEAIIKKYEGQMPKQHSEVIVNRYIKEIAKKAEINEIVRFTKTVGGVTKKFAEEKWKLITNHTGRRSMATNILKHVNVIEAMPVMGMSLKTLQLYNKITAEENAETLKSNSFFTKKNASQEDP